MSFHQQPNNCATPEHKIWGTTTELFRNNTSSTHYLDIIAGGYCSEHRHARKRNVFYVIQGHLQIIEYADDGLNIHDLYDGGTHITGPGIWHKFEAITDTKCIEIYDFTYDGTDIERRTCGGYKEPRTAGI